MSSVWDELKYFKRDEKWGDPDKMDPAFLILLDKFRGVIGHSFTVNEGFAADGHAPNSFHYQGRAVDGRFINRGRVLSIEEHISIAMKSPFGGIGIYTWSPNGPFVHFDNRPIDNYRRVWVCEKKGQYSSFSGHFLSQHLSKKS